MATSVLVSGTEVKQVIYDCIAVQLDSCPVVLLLWQSQDEEAAPVH